MLSELFTVTLNIVIYNFLFWVASDSKYITLYIKKSMCIGVVLYTEYNTVVVSIVQVLVIFLSDPPSVIQSSSYLSKSRFEGHASI